MSLSIEHSLIADAIALTGIMVLTYAMARSAWAGSKPGMSRYQRPWAARLLLRAMLMLSIGLTMPGSYAAEPVIWLETNLPPGVIVDGPELGHGYLDQLIAAVLHDLPEYQIKVTQVPLVRELQMLKIGGSYCSIDLLKTPEREAFLRFTSPVGYFLPAVLVVRAEDKSHYDHYLDANHMISLETLLQVDPGVFGMAVRRTFGKIPDSIIAQAIAKNPGKVAQIYEEGATATLFKMLTAHHIDALLAYPAEQIYLSGQSGHTDSYYAYPIVEFPKLAAMRFDCTKLAVTDGIFAKLDAQAKSPALQRTFQLGYERWLPPYLLPLYRARLKDDTQGASF